MRKRTRTALGSLAIDLPERALMGLAVCSGDDSRASTGTFTEVARVE